MLTSSDDHSGDAVTIVLEPVLPPVPRQRRLHPPKYPLNEPAVRCVVAMIELYPERWHQSAWQGYHGTPDRKWCFASWTVHLAGESVAALLTGDGLGHWAVARRAKELLGLSQRQAQVLFSFGNDWETHPTVEQLKQRITEATGITFGRA